MIVVRQSQKMRKLNVGGAKIQTTLFRVEMGILLVEGDVEFENYNHVYTKDYGFFDLDYSVFRTIEDATKCAGDYVANGAERTYAIITSDTCEGVDEEIITALVEDDEPLDNSWNFGESQSDILYFIYKDHGIKHGLTKEDL